MTDIQTFWFSPFMRKQWFGCPPETDELIKTKYGHLLLENSLTHYLDQIILYDQISRHVYRDNAHRIAECDAKALAILDNNIDNIITLNPEQRCFAIMPWRHTFQLSLLQRCLELVNIWNTEAPHPFYKRFAQATLKAIANVKSSASCLLQWTLQDPEVFRTILDPRSASVPTSTPMISYDEPLLHHFTNIMMCNNSVTVSVSGGVDSMVCLFIAHKLFNHVTCVSIDYANRTEQSLEIQMVNHVCGVLNVPHVVRVIDEVKRPSGSCSGLIDREFYESFTRDIRFATYAKISDDPVILGHNQDDTLENVFSNIKKRKNYDNLFGMDVCSEERGVNIWRPLLHVPKSLIIDFALRHGIPFTYDSTPAWSERGYLRDHVIPAIRDYLPGIIDMVNNNKHLYKVCKNVQISDDYQVCSNPIYTLDYFQNVFKKVALHYKVPYPKNKSLMHLMEQLQRGNTSRLTVSVHFIVVKEGSGFRIIKM